MQGKAEDAGGLAPVKDDCAAVGGRLTDAPVKDDNAAMQFPNR